jgi:hypothetical protein
LKVENITQADFSPEKYVKQGYRYDEASGTLCICDHELIEKVQNGVKVGSKWVEEVF